MYDIDPSFSPKPIISNLTDFLHVHTILEFHVVRHLYEERWGAYVKKGQKMDQKTHSLAINVSIKFGLGRKKK